MVASPRQRLILPLAPLGAGVAGGLTALLFLGMPSGALESLVVDSGIASVLNAAQPPLHFTARAVLAIAGGGAVALLAWVALFVAVGTRSVILHAPQLKDDAAHAAPTLRRADAHPDAPPRQPVFANRDLGTPFLEIRAEAPVTVTPEPETAAPIGPDEERALPIDLDLPLAAFDRQAIPLMPAAWSASRPEAFVPEPIQPAPIRTARTESADMLPIRKAPEAQPIDTGERVAAPFRLISAKMADPAPPAAPEEPTSIRSLLDRLERSVAQREAAAPPAVPAGHDTIRGTLDTLRTMATRAG